MRILVPALVAISMAGCATLPTLPSAITNQVQAATVAACGFLPTISTVASILASFTGTSSVVSSIEQAAAGICAGVTAKGGRLGARRAASFNGVRIEGHFVR
jgi:outer membrane lipoprotein SlyB